jgi:glycosyltransferase involved in cell wall biosynthesis
MPHVLIFRDLREENWPSMELCADMLQAELRSALPKGWTVSAFTPRFHRFPLPLPASQRRRADLFYSRYRRYPQAARRERSDVYHVIDHSYAHLLLALPPDRTVVTCHDTEIFRSARDPAAPWFTRLVCRRVVAGFRRALRVIAVSETTRQRLIDEEGAPPERIALLPNGVAGVFHPEPVPDERERLRRVYGIPETFLLHVGLSVPRKDLPALMAALAGDPALPPLVQAGGDSVSVAEMARAAGIPDRVKPLGVVPADDLAALYRQAAAVVLPSRNEGFGLPAIEAAASGAPVVATDLPAFREVLAGAARYVPVGDSRALAAAVSETVRDPAVRERLRRTGLERAALFSWKRQAEGASKIYLEIMDAVKQAR